MSQLFMSLALGRLKLKHRVVMAPLTRMRAGEPGDVPTSLHVEHYVNAHQMVVSSSLKQRRYLRRQRAIPRRLASTPTTRSSVGAPSQRPYTRKVDLSSSSFGTSGVSRTRRTRSAGRYPSLRPRSQRKAKRSEPTGPPSHSKCRDRSRTTSCRESWRTIGLRPSALWRRASTASKFTQRMAIFLSSFYRTARTSAVTRIAAAWKIGSANCWRSSTRSHGFSVTTLSACECLRTVARRASAIPPQRCSSGMLWPRSARTRLRSSHRAPVRKRRPY